MRRFTRGFIILFVFFSSLAVFPMRQTPYCVNNLAISVNVAVTLYMTGDVTLVGYQHLLVTAALQYNLCELEYLAL